MSVSMYVLMYACICVCMYVSLYVSMYASMYVCIYVCVYVCMFVGIYVCVYVSMSVAISGFLQILRGVMAVETGGANASSAAQPAATEPWAFCMRMHQGALETQGNLALVERIWKQHQSLEDELDSMIKDGALAEARRRGSLAILLSNVVEKDTDVKNAHSRDSYVRFEESGHKYYLWQGTAEKEFPVSVSGVWAQYFHHFDAEATINKYYGRWALNSSSKYYATIHGCREKGMADAEIAKRIRCSWSDAGELASAYGSRMHREIELALTGMEYDASMEEMATFQTFVTGVLQVRRWRLFRAEWTIYDEVVMVAGQIDAVFIDECNGLHMMDWKRVRRPLLPESGQEFENYGSSFCEHLLDNAFNHYALQQNLYAAILRRRYGILLQSMALVQIHPELPGYHVVDVPEWGALADTLLIEAGAKARASLSEDEDLVLATVKVPALPSSVLQRTVSTSTASEDEDSALLLAADKMKQ